jgi:hypothetical protein
VIDTRGYSGGVNEFLARFSRTPQWTFIAKNARLLVALIAVIVGVILVGLPSIASANWAGFALISSGAMLAGSAVRDSADEEVRDLRTERQAIKKRMRSTVATGQREARRPSIRDTIQLGQNQLEEYYRINQGQARNSFLASITAISLGMLTLLAGIWFMYFGRAEFQVAALGAIAGVLLDFIGGAYFVVYRRALSQMDRYIDQLASMHDTMLSIDL